MQAGFGATSSAPAFGSTSFGAQQPAAFGSPNAFGAQSSPGFGASSTPGFGAQSSSAFGGATASFGATPSFGQSKAALLLHIVSHTLSPNVMLPICSVPARGPWLCHVPSLTRCSPYPAAKSTASLCTQYKHSAVSLLHEFCICSPAAAHHGSPMLRCSHHAHCNMLIALEMLCAAGFGGQGFGQQQQQQQQQHGTRQVPYQKLTETEGTGGTRTTNSYMTISCMPAYANKSPDELRWEDYQVGVAPTLLGCLASCVMAHPHAHPGGPPSAPLSHNSC